VWGATQCEPMPKLILALGAIAIPTGSAMAQTVNNAPQKAPAGVQDQLKQARRHPVGKHQGVQSQMQTPHGQRTGAMGPPVP
jgi:hypothetical protein